MHRRDAIKAIAIAPLAAVAPALPERISGVHEERAVVVTLTKITLDGDDRAVRIAFHGSGDLHIITHKDGSTRVATLGTLPGSLQVVGSTRPSSAPSNR